jgi:protein disulfide-isomerase A1
VFVLAASCASLSAAESVVSLDAGNFDAFVQKTPIALVEFYAPWCGHCKQLAPEYEKAAAILKADGIALAKVDAADDKNQKIAEKYEVQGFPTLKLFKHEKASEYAGERTSDAIVTFMRKKNGPPTKDLQNDGDAEEFKKSADIVMLGFFENKDSAEFKAFETAAGRVDDVMFGNVLDNGIRNLMRAEKNQLILYRKFDEARTVYDGKMEAEAIADFLKQHSLPLIVPFSDATAAKIFNGEVKTHVLVFVDSTKNADVVGKLKGPAEKYKGRALFVTISPAEEQLTEYFGVTASDFPALRLVDMKDAGMKKYLYDKPTLDEVSIESFLEDFFNNNLKPTLKTEEEPKQQGAVKVLVGSTFKKEVMEDADKDVVVQFYAPWCGHCKELAPRYDALAEKVKGISTIVVAKVNAEANEIPDVTVEGFPTIKLFAAGKKHEPIEFTGERTTDAIYTWLEGEVTHKLVKATETASHGGEL